jgi:hypothetical protein
VALLVLIEKNVKKKGVVIEDQLMELHGASILEMLLKAK